MYADRLGGVWRLDDEPKLQQPCGHSKLQHYEWYGQPKLLGGQYLLGRLHRDKLQLGLLPIGQQLSAVHLFMELRQLGKLYGRHRHLELRQLGYLQCVDGVQWFGHADAECHLQLYGEQWQPDTDSDVRE